MGVADRHVSGRLVKFIMEGRGLAEGKGRTDYSENRTRQTNEEIRRRKVQRNRAISFIPCLSFARVTETLYVLQRRNHDICCVLTAAKLHVLYKCTQTNIFCGPGSVVGIVTAYGWTVRGSNPGGARFSAPVQTGPEAHPASCTKGTGSFPGVRCCRGVTLTSHPLLVQRSKIE